ncbi:MAG: squalene/phytoene synthase family protein [Alphaproteobacteria bacterium]|nr:squalene/phytoene synthase family protein [Alphaproteobacteria bacterium]
MQHGAPGGDGELAAAWAYCAAQARTADHGRWLCGLFAPEAARHDLWALLAFNAEVARTREVVREPMLGQIRLQWWREAIAEAYAGRARAHQVMAPLADAIARRRPPVERFETLLDGRLRDLDDQPFATLADLEAYAQATSGTLSLLMLDMLGVDDGGAREAATAIGTAWALVGLVRATPHLAAHRRLMMPTDLMGDINPESLFTGRPDAGLANVLRAVVDRASALLVEARRHRRKVPTPALPALVPARLLDRRIARIHRADYLMFDQPQETPSAADPIRLWWAVRTGRF